MAHIRVELSKTCPAGYGDLLSRAVFDSVYDTPEWMAVLAKSFPYYRPHYLSAYRGSTLSAVMPVVDVTRFGVHKVLSLPLSYGGPIFQAHDPEVAQALFEAFARKLDFVASYKRVFLPFASPLEADADVLLRHGFTRSRFDRSVVDLSSGDTDFLWRHGVDKKERNAVRKAEKNGVSVHPLGPDEFDAVWDLVTRTAKRLGVAPDRREFLENVFRDLSPKGRCAWFGAFHDGTLLAVTSFFYYRKSAVYFVNASDPASWRLAPNSLLLWHALQEAVHRGCTFADLGTATQDYPGLRKFKQSFGGKPAPCLSFYKSSLAFDAAMKARKLLSFFSDAQPEH